MAVTWFSDALGAHGAAIEHIAGEFGAVTLLTYRALAFQLLRRSRPAAATGADGSGRVFAPAMPS